MKLLHIINKMFFRKFVMMNTKNVKFWTLLCCLLLLPFQIFAQWSGQVDASGSSNFQKGHKEDLGLKMQFDTTKFHVGFHVSGGHYYCPTTEIVGIYDAKNQKAAFSKFENKLCYNRNWYANAGVDLRFDLRPQDVLAVSLNYGYKGSNDSPLMRTWRYGILGDSLTGGQIDTCGFLSHKLIPEISYVHTFKKKDSKLSVIWNTDLEVTSDALQRTTKGDFYALQRTYTTLDVIDNLMSKVGVAYEDFSLGRVENLHIYTGLDFFSNNYLDVYDGSNFTENPLKDSILLKHSSTYNAFALEPFVNLSYSYKWLDVYVKERVQWYYHSLKNNYAVDPAEMYDLKKSEWQNILAAGLAFRINARHRLSLEYARTLERPDYQKLNTTLIIGKSEGEFFKGNPNLNPQSMNDISLKYSFTTEHFGTDLMLGYRYTKNKFEKILDLIPKGLAGVTTLRTWVNIKQQHTGMAELDLKVDYDAVKANMWFSVNMDKLYKVDNTVNKIEFNYEVGIDLLAKITPTLCLSSVVMYRSPKISTYNYKGEYIGANIKLTKTFLKSLDVSIELNDLVDKAFEEETWDAELTYYKRTIRSQNRCSILLGLSYRF